MCRGRGIESKKRTGDLIVTVDVVVPGKLSAEERAAVEALSEAEAGGRRLAPTSPIRARC